MEHLLTTKLFIPQTRPDLVSRPRLIERLNAGLWQSGLGKGALGKGLGFARKLTLVSAPAGYGKSTLLSCWLESSDIPSVWVSLDENDNDPSVFLFYFLAALQFIFPGVGREIQALLKGPDLPSIAVLGRMLISNLDQINKEFICVLDDFHLIKKRHVIPYCAKFHFYL